MHLSIRWPRRSPRAALPPRPDSSSRCETVSKVPKTAVRPRADEPFSVPTTRFDGWQLRSSGGIPGGLVSPLVTEFQADPQ